MKSQLLEPPTRITENIDLSGNYRISWPRPDPGPQRYLVAAFFCFWLCGWAFGWVSVGSQVVLGQASFGIVCWLAAWTAGGGVAIWQVWRMVQPSLPEAITLALDYLIYDPGRSWTPPSNYRGWGNTPIRRPWPGETDEIKEPIVVAKSRIKGFVLERVGERQRLRFDWGMLRIEVGANLTEPEREWLHGVVENWLHAKAKTNLDPIDSDFLM